MSEPVDRIDPDEPPLFDLDAMHEPDHDVTEGERGDTITLAGRLNARPVVQTPPPRWPPAPPAPA